jgi:hypothetical protein
MREYAYVDLITEEKVIIGYFDPKMIAGIVPTQAGSDRMTTLFIASGTAMMAISVKASMSEVCEAHERAKRGEVLRQPAPKKPIIES